MFFLPTDLESAHGRAEKTFSAAELLTIPRTTILASRLRASGIGLADQICIDQLGYRLGALGSEKIIVELDASCTRIGTKFSKYGL